MKSGKMVARTARAMVMVTGTSVVFKSMVFIIMKSGRVKTSSGTPMKKPRRKASLRDLTEAMRCMRVEAKRRGRKSAVDLRDAGDL